MQRPSIEAFCARIADIFETDSVSPDTDFRALPGWCSLQAFGLLVYLENDCGLSLDISSFGRFATVGDLYAALGE